MIRKTHQRYQHIIIVVIFSFCQQSTHRKKARQLCVCVHSTEKTHEMAQTMWTEMKNTWHKEVYKIFTWLGSFFACSFAVRVFILSGSFHRFAGPYHNILDVFTSYTCSKSSVYLVEAILEPHWMRKWEYLAHSEFSLVETDNQPNLPDQPPPPPSSSRHVFALRALVPPRCLCWKNANLIFFTALLFVFHYLNYFFVGIVNKIFRSQSSSPFASVPVSRIWWHLCVLHCEWCIFVWYAYTFATVTCVWTCARPRTRPSRQNVK